jgi:putative flavoprotein involved in K+ transport
LNATGITNVIWATGYSFDFSMIRLPVTDGDGFPIQTRGVTAFPGLFFIGLPWLHTAKSGLIYGLREDASYIADRVAERQVTSEGRPVTAIASQSAPQGPKRTRATRPWEDRVMTLIRSSALAPMLDGFATHAIGSYPIAPHDPPQSASSVVVPQDAAPQQR